MICVMPSTRPRSTMNLAGLPETKFEDGIKKTIKWYLDNKEWWETIISGEYQNYYEKMYGTPRGRHRIMRVFVTGVGGQLGHDVMNELAKRGYEGVGIVILHPSYSGIADGTAVTTMPYVSDGYHRCRASVEKVMQRCKRGCSDPLCSMDSCRCCRR